MLSGYLITGIIREKIDSHQFSMGDFYLRRFKRIVPVFLFILSAVSIAAFIILLPDELVTFAQSLKSALYFGSNYFFYGEDSYTADASIYKPLLHTWSLAVECQFYLIYPLFIWLICRFFKPYLFRILFVSALISFIYASFIVHDYPEKAFYLLPSRAWELLAGGLITFFCRDKLVELLERITKIDIAIAISVLGVYMIGYSFIYIDDHAANPSFITLFPVLGTCLFILFAQKGDFFTDFFSLRPVVFIGLISYSLYLWHQPVFVFFRLFKGGQLRPEQTAILLVACVMFASISYKLIEKPFRYRTLAKWKLAFLTLLGGCTFAFSVAAIAYDGFYMQFKDVLEKVHQDYKVPEWNRLEDTTHMGTGLFGDSITSCNARTPETACHFGDGSWILIGDSYAGHYGNALKDILSEKGYGFFSFTHGACPFVSSSIWFLDRPACPIVNKMRWQTIESLRNKKNIVIAASYKLFISPKKSVKNPIKMAKACFSGGEKIESDIAWHSYSENIKKLIALGHEVYVIYPVPEEMGDTKKKIFSMFRGIKKFEIGKTNQFNILYGKDEKSLEWLLK